MVRYSVKYAIAKNVPLFRKEVVDVIYIMLQKTFASHPYIHIVSDLKIKNYTVISRHRPATTNKSVICTTIYLLDFGELITNLAKMMTPYMGTTKSQTSTLSSPS